MDKVKDREQRLHYMQHTVANGWGRYFLVHQIESSHFERTGKAITNFSTTLPAVQSDLALQTLKNPFVFDFLTWTDDMRERDLEKALILHMKQFMLEPERGFAWVGNQKNLVVEGDDFFLDLLFYNYHMHCFVVFELKIGEFKPEFAGKLNFYVNAIDVQLKGPDDKPTIGVLLCKSVNETVIKYSLKSIDSPIGVSNYQFEKALPAGLKSEIPTVEELEQELEQTYEELKNPADKKLDRLKGLLQHLKEPEVTESKTNEIVQKYFEQLVPALYNKMMKRYQSIGSWFQETKVHTYIDSHGFTTKEDAENELREKHKYAA